MDSSRTKGRWIKKMNSSTIVLFVGLAIAAVIFAIIAIRGDEKKRPVAKR